VQREPALRSAWQGFLKGRAANALAMAPSSVVQKTGVPPSGDRHDYWSIGPYWWPDPAKPGGLPYVHRDGERNPEAAGDAYDSARFGRLRRAVSDLALAALVTGDERYPERAALLLRTWFLDPATRMHPHLRFAQGVPGREEGRGTGIIDTAGLPLFLDGVALLRGTRAFTDSDQQGLDAWLTSYLDWLLTSRNGQSEAGAANNHGSWYDAQVAALALRTGKPDVARRQLAERTRERIARQIEPDGRQPLELARTRSFGYSVYNLEALATCAALGETVGVDLWAYATADGRSLRRALDALLPYADPGQRWPGKQIAAPPWRQLDWLLRLAYERTGDARYRAAERLLPADARDVELLILWPGVDAAAPAAANDR
jgi:hypothetical protein